MRVATAISKLGEFTTKAIYVTHGHASWYPGDGYRHEGIRYTFYIGEKLRVLGRGRTVREAYEASRKRLIDWATVPRATESPPD